MSRSDTRIEYGSPVTFRHQDSMMRIGVSRSGTRISRENEFGNMLYTQFNEPNSQMSMMGRRESSLMFLVLWPSVMVIVNAAC